MGTGHDAHSEHDVFDDAPVRELPPDEPRTPGWIPALGLGLLVVTLVVWVARSGGEPAPAVPPETTASAPVQAAAPQLPQPLPGRPLQPPAAGSAPARQMTPEQARELQKKIEEMKAARRAAGSAMPTPTLAPGR